MRYFTLVIPTLLSASAAFAGSASAPKLIIAISVDQFSANLFDEYRPTFTGGFKRLTDGVAYSNGYQSHAATETCPGHSTILTGDRPARTGMIANSWTDLDTKRDDKIIYCAEDESVSGSDSKNYTVSPMHLKVPTLGERMKTAFPSSRTVSVAGKDRAAVMMGGHSPDEIWWWTQRNGLFQFTGYDGKAMPVAVKVANDQLDALRKSGYSYPLPEACTSRIAPIKFDDRVVGVARADAKSGDGQGLYTHPALDQATLDAAMGLIKDMKLGKGSAPDMLDIGLSVTDPVGHAFGTKGPEMCAQIYALDNMLGHFLDQLDVTGVNYVIALTADHGGSDIPERANHAPRAVRMAADQKLTRLDIEVGAQLNIPSRIFYGDSADIGGNLYIAHDLSADARAKVVVATRAALMNKADWPYVETVFSRDEILAAPKPNSPPSNWTLLQRVAASYDLVRSGDMYVILKELVMPVPDTSGGTIMSHGSVWDYDRRVPILFYAKGINPRAPKDEIETVDIAPTLAALAGLSLPVGEMDGKCLSAFAPCAK